MKQGDIFLPVSFCFIIKQENIQYDEITFQVKRRIVKSVESWNIDMLI